MSILRFSAIAVLAAILTTGCDSGDVYPKESEHNGTGAHVTVEFGFVNTEAFPTSYKVLFGTFNDDSLYPISYQYIDTPVAGSPVAVTLNDIPEQAAYLGLCLVQEYGNMQIFPFYTFRPQEAVAGDVTLPDQVIDLATFGRVQKQVLSQCAQCHGGSGSAAKGLFLTDDKSYQALYEVYSKSDGSKMLVDPGNPNKSYIMEVLKGEKLQEAHSTLSSLKDDDITLVKCWIAAGADNN